MSVQELSAQMGISLPKAYELVKTLGFPIIRIGARILIPIEAYKESELCYSGYSWCNRKCASVQHIKLFPQGIAGIQELSSVRQLRK